MDVGKQQPTRGEPLAMFCTSLRKRSELESLITFLLGSTDRKWRETRLDGTHDLLVPSEHGRNYHYLMLSAADVGKPETEQRLDRLWHIKQGKDVAVLFLLQENKSSMEKYSQLQLIVMESNLQVPILPLPTFEELSNTIAAFQKEWPTSHRTTRERHQLMPPALPFCATMPLRQHPLNVLSDITAGYADLAEKATSEAGRAELREYLDAEDAEKVIQFWMDNSAV